MEWKYTYMILVKSAIFQLNAISHRCKEPRCCTLPVGKALKHKAMQLFWGFHIPIADQRSVVITWEWNGSTIGWVWVIHIQGNKSNRVESSFMLVLTNLTYRNKCSSIRDTSCRHKNPIGWMGKTTYWCWNKETDLKVLAWTYKQTIGMSFFLQALFILVLLGLQLGFTSLVLM